MWLCTRRLSSTHRAWGHLDSVQLFTPSLCPLLGLPQGTQYPWTPLHPPPQQEKGLREPLRPTSTCSISSLVPAGPGDSARLEMSPSPQGSGHRGQGQAADPSFSLLANCPHEGQQDGLEASLRPALDLQTQLAGNTPATVVNRAASQVRMLLTWEQVVAA